VTGTTARARLTQSGNAIPCHLPDLYGEQGCAIYWTPKMIGEIIAFVDTRS
jgi:hypothetical protein